MIAPKSISIKNISDAEGLQVNPLEVSSCFIFFFESIIAIAKINSFAFINAHAI